MARVVFVWYLILIMVPGFVAEANPFVPKSDLWEFWASSDESSTAAIDHSDWQATLDAYLDAEHPSGINRFDYGAVSAADRDRLRGYIDRLAGLDPRTYSRAEQQAYWINLYNALTVDLVLQFYPVKTIRRIQGGLLGLGPWGKQIVQVAGQDLTLNDIEHRILRPIYREPRIHYAVNCASLGCPNLAPKVFTAPNTESMLDEAARAYVNHPRSVDFTAKGQLRLSSIFTWYQVDFGGSVESLRQHLVTYAEPALAERLQTYEGKIHYHYDWGLNAP